MSSKHTFIEYNKEHYSPNEMEQRSIQFYNWMNLRRTVRDFSDTKIPESVIEMLILTASTAPSGAHKQPWSFCVVTNPDLKKQIRIAAEKEEKLSYEKRMSADWLIDLEPLGTNWNKPFLEIAPALIIVFKRSFEYDVSGIKKNYYVTESVGIAVGFLLAAIHHAGLVALTHTPSPMHFLKELLNRPDNEKPFLLVPIGYPKEHTLVPELKRKELNEILFNY